MGAADTARAFLAALEAHQWDTAAAFLADDFLCINDPDGPIYDKVEFLMAQRTLQGAYPDWSFHLHISREQGNATSGSVYITGTHTGDFVPPPGMGETTILATGKAIALPRWDARFLLHGDLIASLTLTRPPGTSIVPLFDEPASHSHTVLSGITGHAEQHPMPEIPKIAELAQSAAFPLYGLLDAPLGFTLQGFGYEGTGWREEAAQDLSSVSFYFAYPAATRDTQRTFELVTTDAAAPFLSDPPDWREHPVDTPIFDPDGGQYQRYSDLAALRAAASPAPPYLIDRFPIGDSIFAARIQHWRQPRDEWQFALLGATVRLSGSAAGVPESDLFALLASHVGTVTDRPDILARYQSEFDDWQRFFRSQH